MSRWEHTNNSNNLMTGTVPILKKDEITGDALLQLQKLKDSLNYKPISEVNFKYGNKNKKIQKSTYILVKDLITVYKWLPQLCNMATFLPLFSEVIDNDKVKIEDVPKFDKLMYKVMGE